MFAKDMECNKDLLDKKIRGKTVLVIGGAGSIGSSFIKALLPFQPSSLVIADISENSLAELTRDLRSTEGMYIPEEYLAYPIDYSSDIFRKMFRERGGFDIVANFSAHKHVRSEKDIYSIEALLRNNVLNAEKLLELLKEFPPEEYFCVSTDKAANPVNIMGASKRIMEDIIFSYSAYFPIKTARFANVAFSNGSLPAGFLQRMQKLQPISAPSDVTRYFVSLEESGQICLMACMLGENREIFFPKLNIGQVKTFSELAESLLRENGFGIRYCNSEKEAMKYAADLKNGGKEYPVYFSKSDTSGEKLQEEFFTIDEKIDMERFESLGVIIGKEMKKREVIASFLSTMNSSFENKNITKEEIVNVIKEFLPAFEHSETGKSLDSKM